MERDIAAATEHAHHDGTDNLSDVSADSSWSYEFLQTDSYEILQTDLQLRSTFICNKVRNIKDHYLKDLWDVREKFKKKLQIHADEANLAQEVLEHMDILERMVVLMAADNERLPRGLSEETCDKLEDQSNWYVKRFKGERFARTFQELVDCVHGKEGMWVFRPQASKSKKIDFSKTSKKSWIEVILRHLL